MPPPEPRSRTTSPGLSSASAVGFPQPSEAATASAGSAAVSPAAYRFEVMVSHSPREEALPQHELPPEVTRSAALPYFSFTISLISRSAIGRPPLCGRPARGRRLSRSSSATGREEPHQRGGAVSPHGIEDVPLMLAALHQTRKHERYV